jgi:hypothetical protein
MTTERRPWAWLIWLGAFLAIELPAAFSERVRRHWITLSETVPRWFPTKKRFLLLAQFLGMLIVHLYGMVAMSLGEPGHWYWSAQTIGASGALVLGAILYAELWERRGLVKLKDKAVQWFALRWLKGKAGESRKEGGIMKFLDGWKSLILVLGFIAAGIYGLATGSDVTMLVKGVFGALGWDGTSINGATTIATVVVPLLWALWAAGSKLYKVYKQLKAGAKPSELLSDEGHIKAFLKDPAFAESVIDSQKS